MTQSVREREQSIARKIEPLIVGHLTEVLSASGGRIDAYGGIELVRSLRDQIASTLSPDLSKAVEALEPFAEDAWIFDSCHSRDRVIKNTRAKSRVDHFRRAREAYEQLTRDKDSNQ